jgi:hypothetical protein
MHVAEYFGAAQSDALRPQSFNADIRQELENPPMHHDYERGYLGI